MPSTYDLLLAADRLMLSASDYEDPEEFDRAVAAWLGEGDEKLVRLAAWVRANEAAIQRDTTQREAYDAAIKRSRARVEAGKGMAYGLLHARMELGEAPKVPGVARLQKNGGKAPVVGLEAVDPRELADDLVRVTRTPDPDAIRAYLAAGGTLPGVHIGEPGMHVRFE